MNLGNIQRDTGNFEEAMIAYKHALEIEPTHALLKTNVDELKTIMGSGFDGLEIEVDMHGDVYEAQHSSTQGDCGGHVSAMHSSIYLFCLFSTVCLNKYFRLVLILFPSFLTFPLLPFFFSCYSDGFCWRPCQGA